MKDETIKTAMTTIETTEIIGKIKIKIKMVLNRTSTEWLRSCLENNGEIDLTVLKILKIDAKI